MFLEFAIIFIVFLVIDSIWIFGYAAGQYKQFYKSLSGREMELFMPPAVICYFLLALALYLIHQRVHTRSLRDIFLIGALAGFIIYGVYDTTTMAIFGRTYLKIGLMDWIWGTLAMGGALVASSLIIKKIRN